MSGNETTNTPPNAFDGLPPPAFPRKRRRWRSPAPPPDVMPSGVGDLRGSLSEPAVVPPEPEIEDAGPPESVVAPEETPETVGPVEVVHEAALVEEEEPGFPAETIEAEVASLVEFAEPPVPEETAEAEAAPWVEVAEPEAFEETAEAEAAPLLEIAEPPVPEDIDVVVGRIVPELWDADEPFQLESEPEGEADSDMIVDPWEDPHLTALVTLVRSLADELEVVGEAALATRVEMTPFETTLRAYCLGYLEGLRDMSL